MLSKKLLFEIILHLGMYVKQSYSTPVTLNAMQSSTLNVVEFTIDIHCSTNCGGMGEVEKGLKSTGNCYKLDSLSMTNFS